MNNSHKEKLAALKREYIGTVVDTINRYPGSELKFGNTTLRVIDGEPYMDIPQTKPFALFGEDGYTSMEDIANWADIVTDVDACYSAGNGGYSVMWNIPKMR